jgi:hypothetical protein
MTLTVDAIGLYDVPVINDNTQEALDNGVIHDPQTPMPWDEQGQKNVYLAGHRLGWKGTGSRLVFYNLDKRQLGGPRGGGCPCFSAFNGQDVDRFYDQLHLVALLKIEILHGLGCEHGGHLRRGRDLELD